jgi:pimeloyl-ACP methyl ester carboxylesterase
VSDAASAVSDLANGLRLRQIDVLGVQYGADVALELALARPELVRRLVLAQVPSLERLTHVKQPRLMMEAGEGESGLEAAPAMLAGRIGDFLSGRG